MWCLLVAVVGGLAITRLGAAPGRPAAASGLHRHAVIVGISAYDSATRIPQLPQMEASARELAERLLRVADYGPQRVRLLTRRVTRAEVLAAVRAAAQATGRGETLLVALLCAADRVGMMASDGLLKTRDLREAVYAAEGRSVVVLVDAAGSNDLNLARDDRDGAVLTSSAAGQEAWPIFRPGAEGRVDFVSAAAAGWCRALERDSAGFIGDLAARGGLSAEDLQIRADMSAAGGLPFGNYERPLDTDMGFPVVQAVDPSLARKLRAGPVPFEKVKGRWSKADYERWTTVLYSLGEYRLRQADDDAKQRMVDAIVRLPGRDALRHLQRDLLQRGLLVSPPAGRVKSWKALALHNLDGNGRPELGIVEPLRQEGRLWGKKDLAVAGESRRSPYVPTYGEFRGALDEEPLVTVHMRIFGTSASGWWEGELHGQWLRGPWQGRYDPRSGRLQGRIAGTLGSGDGERKLVALFEGTVAKAGLRAAGWWRSPDPRHPESGHWRVDK